MSSVSSHWAIRTEKAKSESKKRIEYLAQDKASQILQAVQANTIMVRQVGFMLVAMMGALASGFIGAIKTLAPTNTQYVIMSIAQGVLGFGGALLAIYAVRLIFLSQAMQDEVVASKKLMAEAEEKKAEQQATETRAKAKVEALKHRLEEIVASSSDGPEAA